MSTLSTGARLTMCKRRLRAEQNWQCLFCGSQVELTTDHIRKQSDGGRHARRNLRALCHRCHKFRHRIEDFAAAGAPGVSRVIFALLVLKGSCEISAVDRFCAFLFRWFLRADRTRAQRGGAAVEV